MGHSEPSQSSFTHFQEGWEERIASNETVRTEEEGSGSVMVSLKPAPPVLIP